ncbi:MAG: hypothetical protein M1819_001391 [Sarea resinae]|nr:MAG: hypothetical protein M1819_001391 [Sarea resinae]
MAVNILNEPLLDGQYTLQILGKLLTLWHAYRTPILLCTLSALFVLRTVLHLRSSREKLSSSPLPRSPRLQAESAEKPQPIPTIVEEKPREQDAIEISGKKPPSESPSREPVKATAPKRVDGSKPNKARRPRRSPRSTDNGPSKIQPMVFFSSLTGSTQRSAEEFIGKFSASLISPTKESIDPSSPFLEPQLHDLSYVDYDDFFITPPKGESADYQTTFFYLFLVPSYNIDTVLNTFLAHLQETHHDFRIDTAPLSPLIGYSVFGFGDKEGWPTEEQGFCSQAKEVDKWLAKLTGRKRAFPVGMGDVKSDAQERLEEWRLGVEDALRDVALHGGLGEGVIGSGDAVESDEEDLESDDDEIDPTGSKPLKRRKPKAGASVEDLEDLGRIIKSQQPSSSPSDPSEEASTPLAIDFTTYGKTASSTAAAPTPVLEMVPTTSPTYTALTKQGYTIVGSHSGVKICRWTKSALRGRGSCYKYSFYGIQSHLCMETTPSLSCSNKCVFCWRHGTNPVGTSWRWQVDPPEKIFTGVKEGHYKKIKMLKGVPGVRAERFQEAMRIRHCALSLVGEPIFYPHINAFTALLHAERISTFLVCNAQHPDQLAALAPVTQLYVSIDASNRDSLRRIDRPLHRDFWERFQRCLDILRARRFEQRTVFRLTLVKGFNVAEEVEGYADLVARGLPGFVEVKGVTYCGTADSKGAGLTMANVPFYDEVADFVVRLNEALAARGLDYGIAAEHAHSCCILLASHRFRSTATTADAEDGEKSAVWHTLIDYDRFFALLEAGKPFTPEDYMGAATPEWARWGHGGFDPRDTRVRRKGKSAKKAMRDAEALADAEAEATAGASQEEEVEASKI